jgi:hypothetical protein
LPYTLSAGLVWATQPILWLIVRRAVRQIASKMYFDKPVSFINHPYG